MAENLPADSYDRLSVAYGLSFEPGKIGKVIKQETVRELEVVAEV